MGGFNGSNTVSKMECYSLINQQWKDKPKMRSDRSAMSATCIKGIEYTRAYSALNSFKLSPLLENN